MHTLESHITIPNNVDTKNDLDFDFLRNLGQEYIEQLSRKLWTDYNIHDPGITIMETLCYAITDLGLRLNQPIEDIIAFPQEVALDMKKQFKTAKEIFTCKPVTANDYRKLFIDIQGVKNCWLVPYELPMYIECNPNEPKLAFSPFKTSSYNTTHFHIKGLYQVLIDIDDDIDENQVTTEIFSTYHKNRNLCEDLVDIKKVPKQCIKVCAKIQLETNANEELVNAKVKWEIEQYLSPNIQVKSLSELMDDGITTDEIFEGPILNNGFITDAELKRTELRTQVRLSDIIELIMNIDGVAMVEDISMNNCSYKEENECVNLDVENQDSWIICIEKGHLAVLCNESTFTYKKGFLPIGINTEESNKFYEELEDEFQKSNLKSYDDIPIPKGVFNIIEYQTIQHHLPENYGISKYGLPANASKEQKVKAKQLQAYLLFFDQVLSIYFSHLDHVKLLLTQTKKNTLDKNTLLSSNTKLTQTYFFKAVEGIEGMEELFDDFGKYKDNIDGIFENLEDFDARRNYLLDHLIARFAEVFGDYTSAIYKLFGKNSETIKEKILNTKNTFLKEYDSISSERGLAFNYRSSKVWDTDNVSGFQKRIALLSGIDDFERKNIYTTSLFIKTIQKINLANQTYFEYKWQIRKGSIVYLQSVNEFNTKQAAINELLDVLRLLADTQKLYIDKIGTSNFKIRMKNTSSEVVAEQPKQHLSKEIAKEKLKETKEYIESLLFNESFYVIENILTLPYKTKEMGTLDKYLPLCVEKDCSTCGSIDPFSYQVTIVFSGFTPRFSNLDYRNFMEDLIRRELPAHILPRICWVGHIDGAMAEIKEIEEDNGNINYEVTDKKEFYDAFIIQKQWNSFLNSKKRKSNKYMATLNRTEDLWKAINQMNTIYPTGTLHNCEDEETETRGSSIVLNRSALGSI